MTPAFFHAERTGLGLRFLLLPLAALEILYRAVVALRARLYRAGWFRVARAPLPVISVGNLAVGGAGKTPIAIFLARRLLSRGVRVAILSRGHGREGKGEVLVADGERVLASAIEGGDEPVLAARRCPGALVLVGRDRVRLARRAAELGAELLLLDDGFQYLALHKDLDLVVLDGGSPFGNRRLLPRGPLRERPQALARAHLCWISKVDEGSEAAIERAARIAESYTGSSPIRSRYRANGVVRADLSTEVGAAEWKGARVLLVAGLARPASFRRTVRSLGMEIVDEALFPDHHRFSDREVEALFARAGRLGASRLVCTEKDAVRLPPELGSDPRVLVVRVEVEIVEGEERLDAWLERLAPARRVA
jgi:tetraacyldisaccharide 4'-kinase